MIATTPIDVEEDWIVCLGETRVVRDGRVACPLRTGEPVPAAACAACRLLTWMHDEREWSPPCTTGPTRPIRPMDAATPF